MRFVFNPYRAFLVWIKSLVITLVLGAIVVLVLRKSPEFIKFALIVVAITEVPIVIIFIQYFRNDNKASFAISFVERKIDFQNRVQKISISFDDIEQIEYNLPPGLAGKGSFKWYPQDDYFYLSFILKDGSTFIVTSLLVQEKLLRSKFHNVPAKRKISFFPFLEVRS